MNNRNKLKFDSLIERLLLDYRGTQVMSAERFKELEERLSIKIPQDYQYFCQVFGSGRLGAFIDVYCLVDNLISEGEFLTQYTIDNINQYRAIRINNPEEQEFYKDRDEASYIELLKSALIFGFYNSEIAFFWDLRTYDSKDDAYDLYYYDMYQSQDEKPVKIGRNFTDFICDFGYGQLACQLMPDIFDESPRVVEYSFYGHYWDDESRDIEE
jgi:SMI1 / KNR4 family (SUKH-1)